MTKNIIVVDSQGKKCGTTYLKRAKGLVKQGRARFLTQTMLCLACPPNQDLEENIMSQQTIENITNENHAETSSIISEQIIADNAAQKMDNTTEQITENCTKTEITIMESAKSDPSITEDKYSIRYCLSQIEHIAYQTEYLNQIISELQQLESDPFCGQKATALADIVKCRENTNQQLLSFYNKIYDDLKAPATVDAVSQKAHLQEYLLKVMEKTLENNDYSAKEVTDMFNGALDAIRHIND